MSTLRILTRNTLLNFEEPMLIEVPWCEFVCYMKTDRVGHSKVSEPSLNLQLMTMIFYLEGRNILYVCVYVCVIRTKNTLLRKRNTYRLIPFSKLLSLNILPHIRHI